VAQRPETAYPLVEGPVWDATTMPVGPGDLAVGCPAYWYVQGEALFLRREMGESCSNFTPSLEIHDFEYELGGRFTFGRQFDCTEAFEVSLTTPIEWDQSDELFSAVGGIGSPFLGLGIDVEAFDGALYHRLDHDAEMYNLEVNWRHWGWGVVSSYLGLRVLRLDEGLIYTSVDSDLDLAQLKIDTWNHLFGPQYGLDLLYPVTDRWSLGMKTKVAAMANATLARTKLIVAPDLVLDNCDDSLTIAFLSEFGVFTSFRLWPRAVLRAGYELWSAWGLALAPDQTDFVLTPLSGTDIDDDESFFLHGGTVGIEFSW
jgi:hypothetical protein